MSWVYRTIGPFFIRHGRVRKVGKGCDETSTDLFVCPCSFSDIPVILCQLLQDLLNRRNLLLLGFIGQRNCSQIPRVLLQPLQLFLHPVDIFQPQLGRDDLHISERVDITLYVNDLGVIECSDDLEDTVDSSDVGQEGVSETCSGGCSSGKTGDIDTCQESWDFGFGFVEVAKPQESFIWNGDSGFFWVAMKSVLVKSEAEFQLTWWHKGSWRLYRDPSWREC